MSKSAQVHPLKRLLQKLEWPLAVMALLVVPALILEDRATNATVRILCNVINWCVWTAFAAEFVLGLSTADSRRTFLRTSWFELLIILVSPPFGVPDVLQSVRGLRALRLLRLLRLVRGVAVATIGLRTAKKSLQSHGFHYVLIIALVATALGAAGIYIVERDFTIKSPEDALWWSIVTVTAVGYGDVTPVTVEGRLIALGLMFVGIGVISVFTATIASAFVGEGNEKETKKRLAALEQQVAEVLQELRRSNAGMPPRLAPPSTPRTTRLECVTTLVRGESA
jgi:voltage-gated potassium channel